MIKAIRTVIFVCSVNVCCFCILFYKRELSSIQRNHVHEIINGEGRKNNIRNVINRNLLETNIHNINSESRKNSIRNLTKRYSLEEFFKGIGYKQDKEGTIKTECTKTIVAYGKHNLSMIRMLRKINFSTCAYSQCQVKYSSVPRMQQDADAILIQSKTIFDLPPPPRRDKDQVYVLAVRDAFPEMVDEIHSRRNIESRMWLDVFNWTMTYRFDSDIVYPYSFLVKRKNGSTPNDVDYNKVFDEKDKDVLWLVSHCHTNSKREEYVKELSTVINVDIYGGCGNNFSCPKGSGGKNIEKCLVAVAKRYKFILAFENTFYLDYVTEKVFQWFNMDMIIVARGGTNYSQRFPHDTIIDAADFESAKELGYYLKSLGSDKNRYTVYLKQKSKFYSVGRRVTAQNAYCSLCEYLHTLAAHKKVYTNIANWWVQGWLNGPPFTNMSLDQLQQFIAINNFSGHNVSTFAKLSSAYN